MLYFLIIYLLLIGSITYFTIKKKHNETTILKSIIIANILLIILELFPLIVGINLIGIVIIVFINAIALIFNKKLSKNKSLLIVSIIIYFVIMFITPYYQIQDHEHIFHDSIENEEIKKYVIYYNCYNIKLFKKYI